MKYHGPFDQPLLPNASFVNGNPSSGIAGSIPDAGALEYPQREIVNAVSQAGLTPTDSDLYQLTRAIRGGQLDFAVGTGTPDAIVAAVGLAHTAIAAGLPFCVTVPGGTSNTTTTPTLTITGPSGVGPISGPIRKATGANPAIGDLPPNSILALRSDGVGFRLLSVLLASDILAIVDPVVQSGKLISFAASGTNAYTGTLTPAPTALTPAMEVLGFFGNGNSTTSPTLDLGTGALPIQRQGGGAPAVGDVFRFVPLILNQAGTAWVINGFVASDIVTQGSIVGRSQVFTASGTFTPPAGVTQVEVELIGGGAAGGASNNSTAGGTILGNPGAGGGGGGYCFGRITLASAAAIAVTIGAGGAAVANAAGGNGSVTSFGSYCSANGGSGGPFGSGTIAFGGAGGTATGGLLNLPGGQGGASGTNSATVSPSNLYVIFARGGQAPRGLGSIDLCNTGGAGIGYGNGGSGASGGSGLAGGPGAQGILIVRW